MAFRVPARRSSRRLVCQELVDVVTDYFEGALSTGDRRRFGRHLARCPGCRVYVQQMRLTVRILGRLD